MFANLGKKIFGSHSDRYVKRLIPTLQKVNELEKTIAEQDDAALAASTVRFRERLAAGESLEDMLPEAFATVREASKRVLGMRHFDVQILGGLVLHQGRIAEMKTGEGKTLVATLPLYANALLGRGVHLVTVNDYLARRDADWMGQIYRFLGMSVGVITTNMDEEERRAAYRSDITYGQNNEFGFDYLRDNMKFSVTEFAQRELHYAIVDEVDSILVDEARTPLIISGPAEDSTDKYYAINRVIPRLTAVEHYTVDEKARAASLTDEGVARVEEILGIPNLYDPSQIEVLHHVHQALKAHTLFKRDVDYMIAEDGKVVIVDEFTGRLMPGRRWSDGLHQAVEAKEGCTIERENQTLATITFQNYFRMYNKLAGMTGTAETEAEEFRKIYNLDVIVMPTHRPMVRQDLADLVYKTEREKFDAVIEDIRDCHERGQPVLVGTISIEKSEKLSALLKKAGVKHNVLNAKHHAREAEIVAQAGRKGAATISTNMAGRGTDIVLGGNVEFLARADLGPEWREHPDLEKTLARYREQCAKERDEVLAAGGLKIVGTERHESRRIDNQLRGRSGRQGDPGASRFYLSLEDDLLRIFGAERIQGLMQRLGMEDGVPIEARMVNRAIENAQRKVEGHNFDLRKHLLEYDDVMNKQREIVYARRRTYLQGENLRDEILAMASGVCEALVDSHAEGKPGKEEVDWKGLDDAYYAQFRVHVPIGEDEREKGLRLDEIRERALEAVKTAYDAREEKFTPDVMRHLERVITLQSIDAHWKDHLLAMDHLKDGIGLRGYGQRNPLQEYQREGYDMFVDMLGRFESDVVEKMYSVQIAAEQDVERIEEMRRRRHQQMMAAHAASRRAEEGQATVVKREADKVGRNDPCPCGSGKKYKKCHGTA
jgi:preprotein translocase subunit SecA